MKTISEEQFKSQYGERGIAQINSIDNNRQNKSTIPSVVPKDPIANRFTEAIGLGGATDVFGKLLARQGVGPQTRAEGQEFVEAPSGSEIAGAVAQTAAIPAGAVLTGGGSLVGQMATGAGLGYVYDVGGSFAGGEDSFAPGVETATGAAIPVALRGFGAGIRGVGSVLKRGAEQAPASKSLTAVSETVSDVVTPVKSAAREFAINRPSRLLERVGDSVEEVRQVERLRENAPPVVRQAIDAGLDPRYINAITDADDATKAGYKEIVKISEEGSQKIGVRPRPEIVAGNAAADQYALIDSQRKNIGQKIGAAIDNLPDEVYNARPLYEEVDNVLSVNGVSKRVDESGKTILDFTGSDVPPKQRAVIQSLYDLLTETGDDLTARQLYNKDRLLSQLQREARFDGVSDIMIKTPDGESVDMFRALREIFTAELEGVAPDIRPLNREYAQLRSLQNDIESSIFRSGNFEGTKDLDPAEFAQTNLRRLFSDAQSAADYRKIYDNLDAYSRALGYEGARADDLAAFATEMRKLYPENVPATSATSIFGGVGDTIRSLVGAGKANVDDQQRALRNLLDIEGAGS